METIRWKEVNGVVFVSLPMNNTTDGGKWAGEHITKGFGFASWAKDLLRGDYVTFGSTMGRTYEVAILPGSLWNDSERKTRNIKEDALSGKFTDGKKLFIPVSEIACFLRELSDEEIKAMGLRSIVVVHPALSVKSLYLRLSANVPYSRKKNCLDTVPSNSEWGAEDGFAFLLSQTQSEALGWARGEDGIVRTLVTSNGMSGKDWVKYFRKWQGPYCLSQEATDFLASSDFMPTNGVTTRVAILPGTRWSFEECTPDNVLGVAKNLGLVPATLETGCLLRKKFRHCWISSMGFEHITVFHPFLDEGRGLICFPAPGTLQFMGTGGCDTSGRLYFRDGFVFQSPNRV